MFNNIIKKIIVVIITILLISNFYVVYAAESPSLKQAIPSKIGSGETTIDKFIKSLGYQAPRDAFQIITGEVPLDLGAPGMAIMIFYLISRILLFVAPVFVLLMLYGGYLWMTAAGNEEQVGKAKKYIINSVIGIVIVLGANIIGGFISQSIFNAYEKTKIETTTDIEGSGESYSVPGQLLDEQVSAMEAREAYSTECEASFANAWGEEGIINKNEGGGYSFNAQGFMETMFSPGIYLGYEICNFAEGVASLFK